MKLSSSEREASVLTPSLYTIARTLFHTQTRLPKDCSEQDIRDHLKKHRDDDPEPIEVHVWYEEHYKYSIAHVIYEGEEYSVPASLAYELSGAVFDGMTLMTGVIDVQ